MVIFLTNCQIPGNLARLIIAFCKATKSSDLLANFIPLNYARMPILETLSHLGFHPLPSLVLLLPLLGLLLGLHCRLFSSKFCPWPGTNMDDINYSHR